MKLILFYLLLLLLFPFALDAAENIPAKAIAPAPFADGDRWCALGDSITESGKYHQYVELFYLTRFPGRKLDVVDCGIRGDTAPGALRRLQWDCLAAKPTVVSVMLGMNDVGRSFYKYKESQDFGKKCEERARTYDQSMRNLTKSLLDAGVKVILIKSSIYDDTADLPTTNLPGCGAALAGYGKRVQAIADEYRAPTVDFNTPMAAINAARQKRDSHFSIVGPDRVHPTAPGHLVMAHEFLRAQGAPGVVAHMVIDASSGKTGPLENCEVTSLVVQSDFVSFSCLEAALPFPVEAAEKPALEIIPFTQELNQEILLVCGLAPGDYELSIDGRKIGAFTSAQLDGGVNLAGEANTPQLQQSQAVLEALRKKWKAEGKLRSLAFIEHNAWPDENRPIDFARASAELDARMTVIAGTNTVWKAQLQKNYLEEKAREAALHREAEDAVAAARQAAQPNSHAFALRRLAASPKTQ